jgi:1-aminocyclopropane-1-carboxylate deaminase/D-cysteine desulfhydrase-like pyridoxal-dependent ACC family enzyme
MRVAVSGAEYAGNKFRKLVFLLAAAGARGARRLITAGSVGSHHALATTVYGKAMGFDVSLVLFPQSLNDHVRRILLADAALGAELRWVSRMEMVPLGMFRARLAFMAGKPFVVAPGGSDAVGTLGWVSAGLELAGQLSMAEYPKPGRIYVAGGTLGTAAGLALGLAMADCRIPIEAVRITSRLVAHDRALSQLVQGAAAILRTAGIAVPDDAASLVEITHDHIGRGYGRETDEGREASRIFADAGLHLDPTYTAKTAAALLRSPVAGPPPLFLQTLSGTMPSVDTGAVDTAALPSHFARYLSGTRVRR